MNKIFYIIGKSCTGKDTIFKKLIGEYGLEFGRIVPYTTRPIRSGEKEGEEYFFTDEEGFGKLKEENKIIEDRAYDTVHGLWRYFTVNDGQFDKDNKPLLMLGVLSSFVSTREYFGKDTVIPIFVDLDDGIRLKRALDREMTQENPKYKELCRRYLADSEDFSEDKIIAAGIEKRFINNDLDQCVKEIKEYIDSEL